MLPLLALPFVLGGTNAALTVATDVVFGLNNAMQGRVGSFSDLFDGFLGGNNDTFVGCVSEGVVHGVMSGLKSTIGAPFYAVYNGVRGLGEFSKGDWIDGLVHGATAVTGFTCVTNLAGKISKASGTVAKSQAAKEGLKVLAQESGIASGAFFTTFIDPWIKWFKAGKDGTAVAAKSADDFFSATNKLSQQMSPSFVGPRTKLATEIFEKTAAHKKSVAAYKRTARIQDLVKPNQHIYHV